MVRQMLRKVGLWIQANRCFNQVTLIDIRRLTEENATDFGWKVHTSYTSSSYWELQNFIETKPVSFQVCIISRNDFVSKQMRNPRKTCIRY